MNISFDPAKREATLLHRGLDFAGAGLVFAGRVVTGEDVRLKYGEPHFVTAGHLHGRCVGLV